MGAANFRHHLHGDDRKPEMDGLFVDPTIRNITGYGGYPSGIHDLRADGNVALLLPGLRTHGVHGHGRLLLTAHRMLLKGDEGGACGGGRKWRFSPGEVISPVSIRLALLFLLLFTRSGIPFILSRAASDEVRHGKGPRPVRCVLSSSDAPERLANVIGNQQGTGSIKCHSNRPATRFAIELTKPVTMFYAIPLGWPSVNGTNTIL